MSSSSSSLASSATAASPCSTHTAETTTTTTTTTHLQHFWYIVMQHCDCKTMIAFARAKTQAQAMANQPLSHKGRLDPIVINVFGNRPVHGVIQTQTIARHMPIHLHFLRPGLFAFDPEAHVVFNAIFKPLGTTCPLQPQLRDRILHLSGNLPSSIDYLQFLPNLRFLEISSLIPAAIACISGGRRSENEWLPTLSHITQSTRQCTTGEQWLHPFAKTLTNLTTGTFKTLQFLDALTKLVHLSLTYFIADIDPVCSTICKLQRLESLIIDDTFDYATYGKSLFTSIVKLPSIDDATFRFKDTYDREPVIMTLLATWLPQSTLRQVNVIVESHRVTVGTVTNVLPLPPQVNRCGEAININIKHLACHL